MPLEKRPDPSPDSVRGRQRPERDHRHQHDPEEFFGLDTENMSPRAQITASLAVLIPVAVGVVAVFALLPSLWWLIFVFGWMIFPGFGLLVRGVVGLSEGQNRTGIPGGNTRERELLGALRDQGELTPAEAAMETSLTVAEADKMLKELAEGGHLQVRVHGGGLFYSLWEAEGDEEAGQLEGR